MSPSFIRAALNSRGMISARIEGSANEDVGDTSILIAARMTLALTHSDLELSPVEPRNTVFGRVHLSNVWSLGIVMVVRADGVA